MGFDLRRISELIVIHGRVARVVIAEVKGSSPREVGASMMVWNGGQEGTIGGGTLEWEASKRALDGDRISRHALGPELGQCCGGAVTLVTEVYDATRISEISNNVWVRGKGDQPIAIKRILSEARREGAQVLPQFVDDWFIEPIAKPTRQIWIWGAGHVGRAMVGMMHPFPELELTWIDTSRERFPNEVAEDINVLYHADPAEFVKHAPATAEHLVLTYSHALDLELCHRLLGRSFGFAGLIGSKSKWARFRNRLEQLGHDTAQINQITCPIGQKSLGKHPQAIAVGVTAALLSSGLTNELRKDRVA